MPALTPAGMLQPVDTLRLRKLLVDSFATPDALADLLLGLNKTFAHFYGLNDPYPTAVQRTVAAANAELWWRALVVAALQGRPTNPELIRFAEEHGLGADFVEREAEGAVRVQQLNLEARIVATNPELDILVWRQRLAAIECQVCRVECPAGQAWGTGFLVGPDVVLTNWHVIDFFRRNGLDPAGIVLRFDYKVLSDNVAVSPGKIWKLAPAWELDASPPSARDKEADPVHDAAPDELDHFLLRVDGEPGRELLHTGDPMPRERGWVHVPPAAAAPVANTWLAIVQHPDGRPMQIAIDSQAIVGTTANGTRVRYRTNTLPGSSGSPCFDAHWNWIALHHSGDPKYPTNVPGARRNQGIPVPALVALLAARGKSALLAS